jgi:hypothetical protein
MEAIIRFEPFRYLLSKALVQTISEKLASCLVLSLSHLLNLVVMVVEVAITLSRVNLACSLTNNNMSVDAGYLGWPWCPFRSQIMIVDMFLKDLEVTAFDRSSFVVDESLLR